jgi:hypothetical protein
MPRSRKPRKAYRAQGVRVDAHELAMAKATLLRPEQRAELIQPARRAFENLRAGHQPDAAWCNLADAMNVAEALARAGIASDKLGEILQAQQALSAVYQRRARVGTLVCTGPELQVLEHAVMLHGIQLRVASQGEVQAAIETVRTRVRQALAGNAPRDALVCVGGVV